MKLYLFGLAAGVFVGNFLFHASLGDYGKGVAIGLIAALLVPILYGVIRLIRPSPVER